MNISTPSTIIHTVDLKIPNKQPMSKSFLTGHQAKSTPNLADELDSKRGKTEKSWNPFNKPKPKFFKEEISSPSNFVHVAGVKSSAQGFSMIGTTEVVGNI